MLTIRNYVKAESLQEAYDLYQKKNNVVVGGMLWLKMQTRNINVAIDLSGLGLDKIEEIEDEIHIGSMVTLRQLELDPLLNSLTRNAVCESVRWIVGVQFRNMATVGGSLYGRYGFSDVLTVLMGMDATVELFHGGQMSLKEFAKLPYQRDIIVKVIVKKSSCNVHYVSHRNTKTDFPVLTCETYKNDGYGCIIGARPGKAVCVEDEEGILSGGVTEESAKEFARYVSEHIHFGSNIRGSSEYRARVCRTLVRRSLLALEKGEASC